MARTEVARAMTVGRIALLLGLFLVPAVLLACGHRLRKRTPLWRAVFWTAVVAHILAATVATVVSMVPPAAWRDDDVWRGLLGFWLLLVAPLGAAIGAALWYFSKRTGPLRSSGVHDGHDS